MANKLKRGNTIPIILMVSSAAFGVFSATNPQMAIPCAITGLGANLLNVQATMDTETLGCLNEELIDATRKALNVTRDEIENGKNKSPSQLRIIDELLQEEPLPQNMKALIRKTESFQRYYCTEVDADDIIRLFEKNLGVQIAGNPLLSQYYALSAQSFTVEKIQVINALLEDNVEAINKIAKSLDSQDIHLENIEKTGANIEKRLNFLMDKACQIVNEFTRIMLALCAFLVMGIVCSARYDITVLILACSSYGISNLIVASLIRGDYIHEFYFNRNNIKLNLNFVKEFFSVILPLLLPLFCYFLLNEVIETSKYTSFDTSKTILTVMNLLPGSFISVLFRAIKHNGKVK